MITPTTRRRVRQRLRLDRTLGFLGRPSDLAVRHSSTGTYYVREELSSGSLAPPVSLPLLPGAYVPPQYNVVVELGYDATGQRTILGLQPEVAAIQGINPLALNPGDPASRGLIRQEELGNLLCRPHPVEALTAQVLPGLAIFGSTAVKYAGGTIDLSGEIPASGKHAYVGVLLKADGTLETASSTAQSTSSALDVTDVQEVLDAATTDSLLLRVFTMAAGDTALDGDYTTSPDWRPLWGPFGQIDGPASSTDNAIARWDGTRGDALQDSGVTIDDHDTVTLPFADTWAPLNITGHSTPPTSPATNDVALDDGSNTASGHPGWRQFNGTNWEDLGARSSVATADVAGPSPPTDAELDSAFGTPATVGEGFLAMIDDIASGNSCWLVWSDGTNWWYASGSKAT